MLPILSFERPSRDQIHQFMQAMLCYSCIAVGLLSAWGILVEATVGGNSPAILLLVAAFAINFSAMFWLDGQTWFQNSFGKLSDLECSHLSLACYSLIAGEPLWLVLLLNGVLAAASYNHWLAKAKIETTTNEYQDGLTLPFLGNDSLAEDCEFDESCELEKDNNMLSQVMRTMDEGVDCISFVGRIKLKAGVDREVLHIPICPPMDSTPEVEGFVVSGHDVRIRVTSREKFGVRVEAIASQKVTIDSESIVELIIRSEIQGEQCRHQRAA